MMFTGVAVMAVRRAAGNGRDEVVIVPRPPGWQLLLDDVAHGLSTLRKRFAG